MVNKVIKVSAPGKIILSGEHSVVYGQPAILATINKRLYVEIKKGTGPIKIITDENPELADYALSKIQKMINRKINHLKITIISEIPINHGLGSSAALAVALTGGLFRWFGKKWNKNLINQIAFEIEKKQHGNPSGADNSIATFGKMIIFQKGKIKSLRIPKFPKHPKLPNFIYLDSGPAIESTGEMVSHVSSLVSRVTYRKIIKELGQTTLRFIQTLNAPNSPNALILLLSQNQRLLEDLGVVGQKAKKIAREIENLGGAAKICGAGGLKKGSGILLCYHQSPQGLLNFAQKNNLKNYQLKLGAEGLRNENGVPQNQT